MRGDQRLRRQGAIILREHIEDGIHLLRNERVIHIRQPATGIGETRAREIAPHHQVFAIERGQTNIRHSRVMRLHSSGVNAEWPLA